MNKKFLGFIMIPLILIFYLFSFVSYDEALASKYPWGLGGSAPIVGGVGSWLHSSSGPEIVDGSTGAWKNFEKTAKKGTMAKAPGGGGLGWKDSINSLPHYGGKGESLYEQCKKSQFIWWYSKDNKGISTQSGLNVHPPASKMPYHASTKVTSKPLLTKIIKSLPSHLWSNKHRGGIVLVCSWPYQKPAPQEIELIANSGEFEYDGSQHVVEGFEVKGKMLDRRDKVISKAYGARTDIGTSPVNFESATKIMRDKKDVTDLYEIKHVPGEILVHPADEFANIENCRTTDTEVIRAVVTNKVTMTPGYTPQGGINFSSVSSTKNNDSYDMQFNRPRVSEEKADWIKWRDKFLEGNKQLSTKDLRLDHEGRNVMNSLAEFGGVVNVIRTHTSHEVTVTFCQPEDRDAIINEEGEVEWGEWYDVGPEIIESIKYDRNPDNKEANASYQILGANCNEEGINKVKSEFEIDQESSAGKTNSILQTKEKEGIDNFPLGKPGHYTGQEVFYKPDDVTWENSCEAAFKGACVSEALPGASNDSKNNKGLPNHLRKSGYPDNFPLFTHLDESIDYSVDFPERAERFNGHSLPDTAESAGGPKKTSISFFRDNEERRVRADVWRLKRDKVPSQFRFNEGAAAKETQVRFKKGTPELEVTKIAIPDVKNFSEDLLKYKGESRTYRLPGEHNVFTAQSKWSSSEGNPYELQPSWGYKVSVSAYPPQYLDGVKVKGWGEYTVTFNAHCPFSNVYEEDGAKAQIPKNPYSGGSRQVDFDEGQAKGSAIRILFNRSVSDKSDVQED